MSKNTVMVILAKFAIRGALEMASSKHGEVKPVRGRTVSFSKFVEYMMTEEYTDDIPEMLYRYLTLDAEHAFEESERKRLEKRAESSEKSKAFGVED